MHVSEMKEKKKTMQWRKHVDIEIAFYFVVQIESRTAIHFDKKAEYMRCLQSNYGKFLRTKNPTIN